MTFSYHDLGSSTDTIERKGLSFLTFQYNFKIEHFQPFSGTSMKEAYMFKLFSPQVALSINPFPTVQASDLLNDKQD